MPLHAEVSIAAMIAGGRLPRPTIAGRRQTRRVVAGVILSAAVLQLLAGGATNAADPPPPGPLDRPIVDLALIDPIDDAAAPPWLLTLTTQDMPPGSVRVALLDRSPGWQASRAETISLFDPADGSETPWLIELGPRRFVVIATSHEAGRTTLVPVTVAPGSTPSLEVEPANSLAVAVDDAGAIDIDANGTNELVVSSANTRRGGDVCQGSVVLVLDGLTLAQRGRWPVPDMRLAGGVLGDWDGRPGGDLLAYAYGNCPAGPDASQRLGLTAIRLADGVPIATVSSLDLAGRTASPGVPLKADLDGDGRDEAVVRDGDALVVFEPARDWARTEVVGGDPMPLLAASPEGPDRPGTLVWLEHAGAGDDLVMAVAGVTRSPDGALAITSERLDLAATSSAQRARVWRAVRDVAIAQSVPQAWRGDIDGDGCADVLAPLLTAQCAGGNDPSPRVGATWFATRPVATIGAGDSRELLIAATMDWDPAAGGPLPASPAAVAPPGAWRHGPSPPFALSVVRAADAAYFSRFPIPRPTIERAAVHSPATDFPGFTGARVFLRVTGARVDDPPPPEAPGLDAFLSEPPSTGELVAVERVPVPANAESGRDGSFVHVSLARVGAPDGAAAVRWTVTIVQVNDWGEVAGPVRGTIARDTSGPSLTVEAPFLSAPWPLEATIHGRSEPTIEIRGPNGGPVTTDRRGRFELTMPLAPWPQTIELRAVDESGNVTIGQYSLVGGIDYRALPWAAIMAFALLVGAVLSASRGAPTVREVVSLADGDPLPEIEELTPTH